MLHNLWKSLCRKVIMNKAQLNEQIVVNYQATIQLSDYGMIIEF